MAAVLACGEGAVLSHGSAAALWSLRTAPSGRMSMSRRREARARGIRATARDLPPEDRTVIDAIPVTSVFRTILDEAST